MPTAPTPPQPPATVAKSTGGGGNDPRPDFTIVATAEGPVKVWKRRKPMVTDEDFGFNPKSLIGSWFHRLENDRIVWSGVILAEPQSATYLVHVDRIDIGAENVQRLIPLERMVNDEEGYDWRFYDTEADAKDAFNLWLSTERKRA